VKTYDDLTPALQAILLHWTRGYTCWIKTEPLLRDRADAVLRAKWSEVYGINLPAWKRQDRKAKGLPNAVGFAVPVVGMPEHRQLILMATEHALAVPEISPFSREKWITRCPEVSDYVMVHEPRERGDYAWSWRLQERVIGGLQKRMNLLITTIDAAGLKKETMQWIRFYALYGGVRRQLRRLLRSGAKLWMNRNKSSWPGPDPEALPAMVGFKGNGNGAYKEPSGLKIKQVVMADESAGSDAP